MDFGLEGFKRSPLGERVGAVLTDETSIIEMIALSKHDIPAVQAVGRPLLALGDEEVKTDAVKKHIGRWVRELLEPRGWTPGRSGRVAVGHLFSTGAIYVPKT